MSASDEPLIDKIGGPAVVAEIVNDAYRRALADAELAPFFEHVSMDRLLRMQYEFIASALDGPIAYSGGELTAVHRGRGITGRHFAAFCGHLADALEAKSIDKLDVDLVLSRLAMYKDKITGDANVDG